MECNHNPRDLLNVQSDSLDCKTTIESRLSSLANILFFIFEIKTWMQEISGEICSQRNDRQYFYAQLATKQA